MRITVNSTNSVGIIANTKKKNTMSIAKGNFAFRMLYAPTDLPADALDRFVKQSAPALKDVQLDPVVGWVGGRHLLDLPITEENATCAGFTKLILRKAERKVPTPRLKAECAIEEHAELKATGKLFVDRKRRKEIREGVITRLLPTMEPSLTGIEFVYDGRSRMVYTTATSNNQLDAFTAHWRNATGTDVIPVDPGTAAVSRKQIQVREWRGTSFSPQVDDEGVENTPGLDFLTWLWFVTETQGGTFKDEQLGEFAIALDGPLLMECEGNKAQETSLRKGLPTISGEAKTALLAGKKLVRAKLMIARGDEQWKFGFDALNFTCRGVKLPEPKEILDAPSTFQNRMCNLGVMRDIVLNFFDRFCDLRNTSAKWSEEVGKIREWAADKQGSK